MLSTPWSPSIGPRVPILNAPTGGGAGGRLAAAVTAAGGLGIGGMDSTASTASLQAELRPLRDVPGIGLVDWVIRAEPGLLDAALAAQPSLLSVSFGADLSLVGWADDAGIARMLHKAGIPTAPAAISRAWIWPGTRPCRCL